MGLCPFGYCKTQCAFPKLETLIFFRSCGVAHTRSCCSLCVISHVLNTALGTTTCRHENALCTIESLLRCSLCPVEFTATTFGVSLNICDLAQLQVLCSASLFIGPSRRFSNCRSSNLEQGNSLQFCAILPHKIIEFLEQGNSLQFCSILPRKAKIIHMEKTLLGLLLSTPSNRVGLDECVSALLSHHRDSTGIRRKDLCMLLALKALLYTYCPVVLTIGPLVRECKWEGRGGDFGTVA